MFTFHLLVCVDILLTGYVHISFTCFVDIDILFACFVYVDILFASFV